MAEDRIWLLPIGHAHHPGASAAHLSFVGAAGDFNRAGRIRNPGVLDRQINGAMENLATAVICPV